MLGADELRAAALRAAEIYASFYADLEQRRVAPDTPPDEIDALFAGTIGDEGIGLESAVRDFEQRVLPHAMSTPHPMYFGLVNSSPLPAAPLGDLLVSMLNNNCGADHQSPPAAAAERELLRVFAALLRQPPDCAGMLLPGGTFATLQGLALARGARFPQWRLDGVRALDGAPRIYTADSAHFSVTRAAQVLGIGERNVRTLPSRARGTLDPRDLEAAIAADRDGGAVPFAVVANFGTTGTGAIDPLAAIADVCAAHDVWLHVDACYGGAAALLPELADLCAGLERADSIAVDPQKWFFTPLTAGLLLTKHPHLQVQEFGLQASYIPGGADQNPFLRGIPTSRRGTALTVWLALRAHGLESVRRAVRTNIESMRQLERKLAAQGFDVLPGGQLGIACARMAPAGWPAERIDRLQRAIAARAVDSGEAWFATVAHGGALWLRFNSVNLHSGPRHVERLAARLPEWARAAQRQVEEQTA